VAKPQEPRTPGFSALFIHRPIATSLLMVALLLFGVFGYRTLPVAALPNVEAPSLQVTTQYPGANPSTMARLVTTPLERQFGQISGLTMMSSNSSQGLSVIILQFTQKRNIEDAAQDVQSAINAARGTLPAALPYPPVYNKVNPADAPILTLALTSNTLPVREVTNYADSILMQKLSQISGVGLVSVAGNVKPAVRIEVNPAALANLGLTLENVRSAITQANVNAPKGSLNGSEQSFTIGANDQLPDAQAYRQLIITYRKGAAVRLSDVAQVVNGVENDQVAAWANGKPAVLLDIRRQPSANIVQTVTAIRAELPALRALLPAGVQLRVFSDRTVTIRASVRDVEFTLFLAIVLVVMVIFVFLRRLWATVIPSVAVPLSLIGTFGVMAFAGFSLDNLSLMALTVATGFVVDDAIVMIENIVRYIEQGRLLDPNYITEVIDRPPRAAYEALKEGGLLDGYQELSNDVVRGAQPRRQEHFGLVERLGENSGEAAATGVRPAGRGLSQHDGGRTGGGSEAVQETSADQARSRVQGEATSAGNRPGQIKEATHGTDETSKAQASSMSQVEIETLRQHGKQISVQICGELPVVALMRMI